MTVVNLTTWAAGRNEIDDSQDINYKPIMEEIARAGYTAYVGQEFIPIRDPLKSLTEAVWSPMCNDETLGQNPFGIGGPLGQLNIKVLPGGYAETRSTCASTNTALAKPLFRSPLGGMW